MNEDIQRFFTERKVVEIRTPTATYTGKFHDLYGEELPVAVVIRSIEDDWATMIPWSSIISVREAE